jgi:hypothetical protein
MDKSASLPLTVKDPFDDTGEDIPWGFRASVFLLMVLTALIVILLIHPVHMGTSEY